MKKIGENALMGVNLKIKKDKVQITKNKLTFLYEIYLFLIQICQICHQMFSISKMSEIAPMGGAVFFKNV